jgi:hypothetical protein
MSENEMYEGMEVDTISQEDADAQAKTAAALAINEFLYALSIRHSAVIAFERATDGEATTDLRVPGNVAVLVNGEVRTP